MKKQVVIDHDILGWGIEREGELLKGYGTLMLVGKHPDLRQRAFDDKIADYCKKNGCDLMTGDAKSYTHFFEAGVKAVRIMQYEWWEKGDRPVYLIQIEE